MRNTIIRLVRKAIKLAGSKWKMLLESLRTSFKRYGERKRLLSGISEKMLVQALKELVTLALVGQSAYLEILPRVEKQPTVSG